MGGRDVGAGVSAGVRAFTVGARNPELSSGLVGTTGGYEERSARGSVSPIELPQNVEPPVGSQGKAARIRAALSAAVQELRQ